MRLGTAAIGTFALLLPLSIEVPAARDSVGSETRLSVIGAVGRYSIIDRGCDGQVLRTHPRTFTEGGLEAQHRFGNGVTLGTRAGTMSVRAKNLRTETDYSTYPYTVTVVTETFSWSRRYVNPSLSIETPSFGFGGGWVWADPPFRADSSDPDDGFDLQQSFHLRIGSLDRRYFRIAAMENVPLNAGGGDVEVGVGGHLGRQWDLYAGLAVGGPFDGAGIGAKLDYRVHPHAAISLRGRLGNGGGEAQNGLGLGVTLVSRPPVDPPKDPPRTAGGGIASSWGLAPKGVRPEPSPSPAPPAAKAAEIAREPSDSPPPDFGEYQYVDSLAAVLTRVEPEHPDSAGSLRGTVVVGALVASDGRVKEVRIIQSVPGLDQAAMACVRQWTFRPALRGRRAVASWVTVPLQFDVAEEPGGRPR